MKPTFNISPSEKQPELYNAKIRPQKHLLILYDLMELSASSRLLKRRAGHFANL